MSTPEAVAGAAGEPRTIRFGVFEVDRRSGELRNGDISVRLADQSFRILELLLERPGDVVTREELVKELWPGNTFVDFDRSLNAAVKKLRRALGDSPRNPKFVETLPRRGYRFIAPIQRLEAASNEADANATPPRYSGESPARESGWLLPRRLILASVGLAAIIPSIVAWRATASREAAPNYPLRKFAITPPREIWAPAISPDGGRVAYTQAGGDASLWIQEFDQREPYAIESADGAQRPFWSPDSESLVYGTADGLYRVSLTDDVPVRLCSFPRIKRRDGTIQPGHYQGGVWSPHDGSIFFSLREGGIYRVADLGGDAELVFGERFVESLNIVGGESRPPKMLYTTRSEARFGRNEVVLRDLRGGERSVLLSTEGASPEPVYSNSGYLIYRHRDENSDSLWGVAISLDSGALDGKPFLVAEYGRYPSVSVRGDLTYLEIRPAGMQRLVWRGRDGRRIKFAGEAQTEIREPALSPNGRFAAVMGREHNQWDIWVHDLAGGSKVRLTTHPVIEAKPNWTNDGKEVVFLSAHEPSGVGRLYAQPADPSAPPRLLDAPPNVYASGFTGDGNGLVFHASTRDTGWDVKMITHHPGGYATRALATSEFDELEAKVSPDSRLLAYCSNETGRMEVYVQEIEGKQRRWRVSEGGGTGPRWRGDGRELFFVKGEALLSASVSAEGGSVTISSAKILFENAGLVTAQSYPQYDVSADGSRILTIDVLEEAPPRCIRVVQNWLSEFRTDPEG